MPLPATHSASALEELSRCPYRYLLRILLRLEVPEEPEETISLTPAGMGEIAHEILRFLGKDAAEGKGWGDTAAAARRAVARFARENPTGLPGLFRIQCLAVRGRRGARGGPGAAGGRGAPGLEGGPGGGAFVVPLLGPPGVPRPGRPPGPRAGGGGARRGLQVLRPEAGGSAGGLDRPRPLPPGSRVPRLRRDARPGASIRFGGHLFPAGGLRRRGGSPVGRDRRRGGPPRFPTGSPWRARGRFPPIPHHRFTYAGKAAPRYCDPCPFKDHCRVSPAYDGSETGADALAAALSRDPVRGILADHRPERG